MKKIISIIVFLLCAIAASAVSYASPYTGAGRSGYVYTTSSARVRDIGSAGLAQAPVASMSTTSSSSRGITTSVASSVAVPQIRVVQTSASSIRGGVTTAQTYKPNVGPRRASAWPGGNPEGCDCDWQYDPSLFGGKGGYICTKCGATISIEDYYDLEEEESPHGSDPCPCATPIREDKDVWAFIAALAGAYALYKVRTGKTPYGDVRDDREMVAG